jgi:hypothetical protein
MFSLLRHSQTPAREIEKVIAAARQRELSELVLLAA